jgi:hypothetical protein
MGRRESTGPGHMGEILCDDDRKYWNEGSCKVHILDEQDEQDETMCQIQFDSIT